MGPSFSDNSGRVVKQANITAPSGCYNINLILLVGRKKVEPITPFQFACYRLCVCASGSLITDIFSCFTSISVSFLHFGQNNGKFLSTVSSRNLIRVLFLQMGHSNHSLGVFDGIFKFGSYLAIHFDLSPSADDRRSAKRDADTLCKLRGHLFLIPRRAPNK